MRGSPVCRGARALAVLSAAVTLAGTFPTHVQAADAPRQTLRRILDGLVSPMAVASPAPDRLLVADQAGLIHLVDSTGQRRSNTPFLDLRPKMVRLNQGFDERGLLGLALHPGFAGNRRLFVYYSAPLRASAPTNWNHTSRVSEFTANPDLATADPASERVLLEFDQPYFNHNGGRIAFGPDGLLYLGIGDGGNANDQGFDRSPTGNAQDLTTLLGKILRIDVDHADPGRKYRVPKDNPLVAMTAARPEIYAWGIRNPWGMSFDRGGSHELFAADVGQGRYEEVNIIRAGANYGWNLREGFHAFDPKNPARIDAAEVMQAADRASLADPILEYKNLNAFPNDPDARGISVTGGYVYRGKALPHLTGRYLFADWSRQWAVPDGRLLAASRPTDPQQRAWSIETLPLASHPDLKIGAYIVAFGEDAEGEVYVLTTQKAGILDQTGVVWKLVPP